MTYLDKYPNCNGCPVERFCGTVASCIKLCHSYKETNTDTAHVLTLSKAAPDEESEFAEGRAEMWDRVTD